MQCLQNDPKIAERKNRFILVVESSPGDRFYTSMLLQRFAYHVCTANGADEAADFMTVAVPALVVADVAESGTGGPELLRRMRQQARLSAIPVILLSSAPDRAVEQQCRLAGCTAYLRKPVQAEELFRAVQEALEPMPRKHVRITTRLRVRLKHEAAQVEEYATVLSEHGMFVRTTNTQAVHTRLPVTLEIDGRSIPIDTIVLYSFAVGEGPLREPGLGLKFVTISPGDATFIRAFIRKQIEDGITGAGSLARS